MIAQDRGALPIEPILRRSLGTKQRWRQSLLEWSDGEVELQYEGQNQSSEKQQDGLSWTKKCCKIIQHPMRASEIHFYAFPIDTFFHYHFVKN